MTLILPCAAQDVKSKDGVPLGQRSEFISFCTKGADKELMNIKGMEIETYKYCACVCDNLIPTINKTISHNGIHCLLTHNCDNPPQYAARITCARA